MKILLYSYNYHPEPIGIAPLMTELAEGLVSRGYQVRVLTAFPWYPEGEIYSQYQGKFFVREMKQGVQVDRCYIYIKKERSVKNRALFELSFMIFSFLQGLGGWRPDVILLTVPGLPVCIPASILGWIYGCPVVLNLQDILPDAAVHVGLITNQRLIKILSRLESFAYQMAHKITVIADGFTENIVAKGVSLEKIVEIPNWVNVDFVKPLEKENNYFRKKYNLENNFIVMYSGNIALTQGLETVIEAGRYLQDYPTIVLVIVGAENALYRLQRYCEQCQVNNVVLIPFQPREKLPEMLASADIGLVVQKKNVISFNMPSKIQVLLASGRAIIASVPDNGTASRAIKKSEGGIVIPPENPQLLAESIIKLYHDPDEIQRLGKNGRSYAESHYCFQSVLNRYEELFNSLKG